MIKTIEKRREKDRKEEDIRNHMNRYLEDIAEYL